MFSSGWKTVTLDYNRTPLEFTGDDADRYSELLDLGESYEFITVIIPALSTEAKVTPYIQDDAEIDTVPTAMVTMDDNATGHFAHATASGAGDIVPIFRIGGAQYLRLHCDTNQADDRVFYVLGFNRLVYGT